MLANLFVPSADSLLHLRREESAGKPRSHWFPWLMLVWSIWIFITPLLGPPDAFPHWRVPTLASFAVFLWLFWHAYYRNRRHLIACVLGIAAIGFALTPINPGAQGYLIYACAFLAFCLPPRQAVLGMAGIMIGYSVEWLALGLPWLLLLNAIVVGIAVGLMNVSYARKMQTDAALKLSHEEVRRLAALSERERIGRDLHDLLGHTLSLVALKSELAGKLIASDPAAARREIVEVTRVARDALTQVRSAVTGIRAAGLAAELASARLLLETDAVAFHYDIAPVALPQAQEIVLAMTLREAVTNIQRHARARSARVTLVLDADAVVLRIVDDGRGGAIAPGNGLSGMRERIEALGGRLRVESGAQGTCVDARLPLPPLSITASLPDVSSAAA
ncbi:MAG TPA: sensor histidine kinase [Luteimonas sp.]|nr:sensor histidine kinase [Luteimonas sp.]